MGKNRFLLFGAALMAFNAWGQAPTHTKYIQETKENFYEAYSKWKPGKPLYEDVAEDEQFYISRVKPKTRFTNAATQVDPKLSSDRKLLWWCPIGMADGGWKALPSYHFDSEVFSMWNYVDIYGYWTAPMIRMEGAFADICHKNGVVTSTLASIPFGSTISATDGGHGQNMKAMIDGGAERLLEFLRYYGIDGIGYNSEFNMGSGLTAEELKKLLSEAFAKRDQAQWPTFTNAWYSLMNNEGRMTTAHDELTSSNKDWFDWNGKPTSDAYFMNYNWGASKLSESQKTATGLNRSSYDVYAGMDFQGRDKAEWVALKDAKISVGIWGAHNMNMIYETRGENGSTDLIKQQTYQKISENVFTGSTYNPVNDLQVKDILRHTTSATDFHGFAKFITARSVLATEDLAKEPFVTYFNMGNGTFFNVEGERTFNNEWYNIGIQDYLPTWRWWWTTKFMGRETADIKKDGMKAEFTWEDAWFGGSCLSVSGQTDKEYLQLFKTQYPLKGGDVLTVRYKVVSGTGSMSVVASAVGEESKEVAAPKISMAYAPQWVEKQIKIGKLPTELKLADKTMAMMALRFENTSKDFKVLLGEVSLTRGEAVTPDAPKVVKSEIMASNYKGVDVKIVFDMTPSGKTDSATPVYNSDVNTWYYKIYTQQEGQDKQVMCTATTSWAAYVVGAPYDYNGSKKMRVGVSAVSADGKTESDIAWDDYKEIPAASLVEGVQIDKPVIKENEDFTIKFIDPTHPAALKWEIIDPQSEKVLKTVDNAVSVTASLPEVGIYDLKVTLKDNMVKEYQALVQISPKEVGAMPEIKSFTANGQAENLEVDVNKEVKFEYTGRNADGFVSRGARLSEIAFGVPAKQLNLNSQSPFTIAYWFCPVTFNHAQDGTQMLNIRSDKEGWPQSDWGYIWTTIEKDNTFKFCIRKGNGNSQTDVKSDKFVFRPNQWYHIAVVVDWKNGRDVKVYINGSLFNKGEAITDVAGWNSDYTIMMGGKAFNRAGFDGYIDEFKIYKKGLSAEEVKESMKHAEQIPAELVGYWDFETEADAEGVLMSSGSDKNLKGYLTDITTISEGVNRYVPKPMVFGTGAPFISGSNYKIETKPVWKLEGASVTVDPTGNGEKGSVTAQYATAGKFDATLILTNGWGSVSKTFSSVTVKDGGTGIEEEDLEEAYAAYPNPFYNDLNVNFADEGSYMVEIFNANGGLIHSFAAKVEAGENVPVVVNGGAGIYFINISKEGKILRALKVIKK